MLFENGPDNGDNKDDDDNHDDDDDDDDDDDGHVGRDCNHARGPLGGWCFKPWCSTHAAVGGSSQGVSSHGDACRDDNGDVRGGHGRTPTYHYGYILLWF